MADLLVEPQAIKVAQLRENRERVLTGNFADRRATDLRGVAVVRGSARKE
jgi:hypothetical protein